MHAKMAKATAMAAASAAAAVGGGGGNGGAVVVVHWFRKGLRLHDNPALLSALSLARSCPTGRGRVYPFYVTDGSCFQLRRCTPLRAQFLVDCLSDLDGGLRGIGSRLYVRGGDPAILLPEIFDELGVTHLTFDADETGEPYAARRDEMVTAAAERAGIVVRTFRSETVHALRNISTKN